MYPQVGIYTRDDASAPFRLFCACPTQAEALVLVLTLPPELVPNVEIRELPDRRGNPLELTLAVVHETPAKRELLGAFKHTFFADLFRVAVRENAPELRDARLTIFAVE